MEGLSAASQRCDRNRYVVYYNLAGGASCPGNVAGPLSDPGGRGQEAVLCRGRADEADELTRWSRVRDLEFLGKSSFVDLARLLRLVGSREREEEGWSWVGLGWDQAVAWSSASLGQPRPALGTRSGSDV
jgi:hypothetical protein